MEAAIDALRRTRLAAHTRRSYGYVIAAFARWLEQTGGSIESLAEGDLRSYKARLKDVLRRRPATINHQVQALRWLCRWAQGREILKADLSAGAEFERVPPRRRPANLAEGEVHRLIRAAGQGRPTHRARDYAILQLLLQAGLRVGEAVSLKVADITLYERSGVVRVRFGKGGKEREVPLNISARRALRAYLDTRPGPEPEEPLFLSQQRRPMSARMVEHLVGVLSSRAKLETPATPHRLRHTFAINYLREHPGNLVQLRELLGHESVDTTAIYTQPSTEELAAQLEASQFNVFER
ncbi:MAG: tyrosine-type recombinase/integrase [Candidatus Latescibacterota bacterium]